MKRYGEDVCQSMKEQDFVVEHMANNSANCCIGKVLPPEVHEEYLSGKHGHGVCIMNRIAPLKNWTKDVGDKYFFITDINGGSRYQIEL